MGSTGEPARGNPASSKTSGSQAAPWPSKAISVVAGRDLKPVVLTGSPHPRHYRRRGGFPARGLGSTTVLKITVPWSVIGIHGRDAAG